MSDDDNVPPWRVRDYTADDADAFAALNRQWIEQHFTIEASDEVQLRNPDASILGKGGHIVMAASANDIVGTGALVPATNAPDDGLSWMQIAKMVTRPDMRGQGIAAAILQRLFRIAETAKVDAIWLETNSKLTKATALYEKHGFTPLARSEMWPTPYARCDMQMVRRLRK